MRFPFFTVKHGGIMWILVYGVFILGCGIPFVVMELTLGQKMQRAAGGAMRGLMPRLTGAGWAASFAGLVKAVLINVVIGLAIQYMFANDA